LCVVMLATLEPENEQPLICPYNFSAAIQSIRDWNNAKCGQDIRHTGPVAL